MQTIHIPPQFESWRAAARTMLAERVPPEQICWSESPEHEELFPAAQPPISQQHSLPQPTATKVSAAFFDFARSVAAHRDPRRWAILYRMLWRHTHGGDRALLLKETDPDVRLAKLWAKAVGRDIHKMHAFVRFKLTGTSSSTGREQFIAWYEPEHRITRLASPFFRKRFAGMDWSILTPDECAHWDGSSLHFTPGLTPDQAPAADSLEDLWRTYYRSIFNPARLKIKAMQSEMPQKFWKHLPEATVIPELIQTSTEQVNQMFTTSPRPVKPVPKLPYLESLLERNQSAPPQPPQPCSDSTREKK